MTGYIKNLSQNIAEPEKSMLTYSKNKLKKLIKKHYKRNLEEKNTEVQLPKGKPH